jgi:hypothetical protein
LDDVIQWLSRRCSFEFVFLRGESFVNFRESLVLNAFGDPDEMVHAMPIAETIPALEEQPARSKRIVARVQTDAVEA